MSENRTGPTGFLSAACLRLAVVLLCAIAVTAGPASAQVPSETFGLVACNATSVPPIVRAEGVPELVGDIVLVCDNTPPPSGGDPSLNTVVTNLSVSLNVNVTNNIHFGKGSNLTDAVMVVNENNCPNPSAGGSVFGSCGSADPRFQDPQLGFLAANNRLAWNNFSLPVPGASASGAPVADCSFGSTIAPGTPESGCFPFVTTIRITSLRANASQLGIPATPTFPSTQITAFVSITGPTTIPVTNNVLNVAVPILGLVKTFESAGSGLQCQGNSQTASVTLHEGFATAFKINGTASYSPGQTQSEAGYPVPLSNGGDGVHHGTRFILRFPFVPSGVVLSVPKTVDLGPPGVDGDALRLQ